MKAHPIVLQMHPSSEQWPAIRATGRDVVVTAGAGTGKTRALVARYLSLLARGLPLRSMVAITFTRKAAREMRNRVRDEIRRYLELPQLDEEEHQYWQRLYAELDAARIGTIHNLCTEILRTHPAEAGVDPRFQVLEEGQTGILRRRAVEEAMAWAVDDATVAPLFALLGERELGKTVEQLLARRLEAQETFSHMPGNIGECWQKALRSRQELALTAFLQHPAWSAAIATLRANPARDPSDRIEVQRREVLAAVDRVASSLPEGLASLPRLAEIDLRGGSARHWDGGPSQRNEVKSALHTLRDLWANRDTALQLTWGQRDETLAQAMPALQALFTYGAARYKAAKEERQALDFDDLEHGAVALLRDNAAVRTRWQNEVRAILVDEFQDTNDRQRNLMRLLNSGGNLFIVGDAKQSIYRFRGADVTILRSERGRIIRQGGMAFQLGTSYRAHRSLIDALNGLLEPVLGSKMDPVRPWAEPFAPLQHCREDPAPGFTAPHIELHLAIGSKAGGALDRAADALVWRMLELEAEGALQRYEQVAILCRASSSFVAYEDALERAGVPFLTVAGRGFQERPEIRDLLNALQALADPTDDLALAGLLRSPALSLSDAALYHLCQERARRDQDRTLWDTVQAHGPGLPGEDGPRAGRAISIIAGLHGQVGRSAVADLLKGFLDATDYRAALIRAGQSRAARNVAKLLADANASGIVGVGEFLEYMADLRLSGAREGEARALAEGAVQIMSVHAAKGLEFPIVVIGDITHKGPSGSPMLFDPELGILLPSRDDDNALPAMYRLGRVRHADQEAAETDRLLYVAATRASEKLILSGCVDLRQDGTIGKAGGWLEQIAGSLGLADQVIAYDEAGTGTISLALTVGHVPIHCAIHEPRWETPALPEALTEQVIPSPPLPPALLAPIAPGKEQVDLRIREREHIPPQRVWRVVPTVERPSAPAWVVGALVHEALAGWRFPDGKSFDRWAEARARGHGITDRRQTSDAVRECGRLLHRFQEHALFREMDSAERRLHEVPYSLQGKDGIESGIIDALYFQEGTWTVVEFKTDRVRNQVELEELLVQDDYRTQVQRYADAVQRLLGQRPRTILCMLNYAGGVWLETI